MPRSWSWIDFLLVYLGGLVWAAVVVAVSALLGDDEMTLVLGLTGQYIGHLVVLWLLARHRSEIGFAVESTDTFYLGLGLLLQLALAVIFLPLSLLLFPDGESAQQVGTALAGLETTPARLVALVTAVVLVPVAEELMFRGVLLKALGERAGRTIIVVTALVFAASHLIGLDPSRMLQAAAVVLPQLFIMGLVLAWVTLRSKRLGPAIFIHSGYNLVAAVVFLVPSEFLDLVG